LRNRIEASRSLKKSPTATGFVLLFLIWHAFFVSATHLHRDARLEIPATTVGHNSVGSPQDADQSPVAITHAQCLLCRLQRNFICDLEQAMPATLAPPASMPCWEILQPSPHSETSTLSPSGRAPPFA
jgi:hypothetical protein